MVGSVTGLANWLVDSFGCFVYWVVWDEIVWLLIMQNILWDCTINPAIILHDMDQFNFSELRKVDVLTKRCLFNSLARATERIKELEQTQKTCFHVSHVCQYNELETTITPTRNAHSNVKTFLAQ
jgi:hypothetical protein